MFTFSRCCQLVALMILSLFAFDSVYAETSSFNTRGRVGGVKANRRLSGDYTDSFCFPVGDCHTHYSYKNVQPFLMYNPAKDGYHLGEDWNRGSGNDDYGDAVYSVGAGIVTHAQDCGPSWGNCIITSHNLSDGSSVNFLYAHLKDIHVKKFDVVALHQEIGSIGTANGLYSAHLHFEGRYKEFYSNSAGYGYTKSKSEMNKFFNPTEFISARLPKKYTVRPIEQCVNGTKKVGGVLKCEKTAQGGFVNNGDILSPLITIDNVWVNHMFETKIYKNNVLWKTQNSDIRFVDQEYGWSVSQGYHSLLDDEKNTWRFDVYLHEISGTKTQVKTFIGSTTYVFAGGMSQKEDTADASSKYSNTNLLKYVETCKDFGGGANTDWVYTCKNPSPSFSVGDSIYLLVGVMNLPMTHRFLVKVSHNKQEQWTYVSQWNVVAPNAPWKWAYTWPKISDLKPGSWDFDVKLELENGVKVHLVKRAIGVSNTANSSKSKETSSTQVKTSGSSQGSSSNSSSSSNSNSSSSSSQQQNSSKNTQTQQSSSSKENSSSSNTSSNSSKDVYKFQWTKVCSSVSAPTTDWSYSCIGEKTTFQSGVDKIHLLTKISDVWTTHSFTIKVYRDGKYLWQWTSGNNVVNESTGWTKAFFFPYLVKPGNGSWKVDVYINTKYGSKLLSSPQFTVGSNKPASPEPTYQQQKQQDSQENAPSTPQSKTPSNSQNQSNSPSYQPKPTSGSTGTYAYESVGACKSVTISGKCMSEGYYYPTGSNVYFSVAVNTVSHPFQIKITGSNSSGGSWSWTSGTISATDGPITKYVVGQQKNIPAGSWFYTVSIKLSIWSSYKVVGQTDLIVK